MAHNAHESHQPQQPHTKSAVVVAEDKAERKKDHLRVLVTNATRPMAHTIATAVAQGYVFGYDQPIILHLLDGQGTMGMLEGLVLELLDCTYPLLRQATDNIGKGVIRLVNIFITDYILANTPSPNNPIIGAQRLGSTNVVTLTFEHSNIPRLVFFLNEATLVQQYRKANAVCAMWGKSGHRTDACPAPVTETEGCSLGGKTGLEARQPHECHPSSVLCGGSHATGSRDCPRRYRQPASAKPLVQQAGQASDHSRTPSGDHKKLQRSNNVAGNDTSARSSRPR
ncbi:hypothetical protein HPB51_006247 [Rhipicephalus microplus]|uniref:Uncharacterized protein n=1 Tax=Rhipicephalus microplus TaxID=6941 RepID=A0A9J6DLV8_RHIMP|nr:hypothetical protein HPB51_006247 [Rhipicephalus microplus]